MNDPWDTFTVFHGNARLDKSVLHHNTKSVFVGPGLPLVVVDDTYADVAKFYQWLDKLRTDFKSAGIPDDYIKPVRDLLNIFFPRDDRGRNLDPVRVRAFPGPVGTLNPIKVPIGQPGHFDYLQITDGATALAYVFSIVKPTVAKPTWTTYYGPLLIIFARCIHLAFVIPFPFAATIADQGGVLPSDIPMMAGIMYLISDNPVFMLSASMMYETASTGAVQVERQRRAALQDQWRFETLLGQSLDLVPWERGEPIVNLPKFPPISARDLFRNMYLSLFRLNIFRDAIVQPIQASLLAMFINTAPPDQKGAIPLGFQRGFVFVANHSFLRSQLEKNQLDENRGTNLLAVCFDENAPDPVSLQRAFEPLITFRLALHMFPPRAQKLNLPDGNQKEIPLSDPVKAALATAVTAFYTANIATLSQWALTFHSNVISRRIRSEKNAPFGRCAETYGVASMMPRYFPETKARMREVRGAAVDIRMIGLRALGDTEVFAPTFPDGLDATKPTAWRRPCDNCKSMMPAFKLGSNIDQWDQEMRACTGKNIQQ
ncbi:hypothetical protein COCVIDRAFT_27107 [Bipolaris victoriae FI3]|uniref:Uncharacterized protein n=1 Tax=Bipolaris victoriae (strain FI3) TaxID=930091 RepID=W7EDZ8_BIPV3|nr:hypothetical protein COCVIDRAFT_27107 [Bipolaris victoriae FI3]